MPYERYTQACPTLPARDFFGSPSPAAMLYEGYAKQSLTQILTETRSVSYSEVASVTLLTWDILVMLSEEVELIWEKRWTPAKALYLAARYIPWASQLALLPLNINGTTGLQFSATQCEQWLTAQAIILQLITTTVDAILMMRVYALYNKNRILLAVLFALFIAEVSGLSYILAIVTPELTFNDDCFVTSSPPLFVAYWIISLAFETALFVLTLLKFAHAVKHGWGRRPVMKDFVTDGTWAYALIFVTMLVNAMLYKFVTSPLAGICFTWLLSVLSFAGSRLILNPRRRTVSRLFITSTEPDSIPLSPLTPHIWYSPTTPTSPNPPSPLKMKDKLSVTRFEESFAFTSAKSDCGIAL